jgi:phosphatidylcholine synthase
LLMPDFDPATPIQPRTQRARGFAIHVFTASGAALALLAMIAAADRDWPATFLWLGVALIVDGVDGPLARRLQIEQGLPRWSGEILDLVVDFLTYVFVPAFAIAKSGLLPGVLAPLAAIVIVITGALYFADRDMKLPGNYFRGFPALWNVAAFYLLLLRPPSWVAVAGVGLLAIATFLRFPFIHPGRVRHLRALNIALLALWGVLALFTLACDMAPGFWVTAALCAIAVYVIGVGVLRRAE